MSKVADALRALDRQSALGGFSAGLLLFWQQIALHSVTLDAPEFLTPVLGDMSGAAGWVAFVVALTAIAGVSYVIRRVHPERSDDGGMRARRHVFGCACMFAGSLLTLWTAEHAAASLAGGALAGAGFALESQALIEALVPLNKCSMRTILACAVLAQLVCALAIRPLPASLALGVVCALPLLLGFCLALLRRAVPIGMAHANREATPVPETTGPGRSQAAAVSTALSQHEARSSLLVCLVAFFFALFYTNVTGPRFSALSDTDLLSFNLDVTVVKCLVIGLSLLVAHQNYLRTLPMAIITLFTTSMLVAAFAPDSGTTFLVTDSLAAAGRLLAFVYALACVDALHRAAWPRAGVEAPVVVGLSGVAVLLSVLVGIVVQNYISLSAGGFTLTTAVVLYILLIASNVFQRREETRPVVVRLEGAGVDEEALAMHRAQALAARFPELTERETQIVGLILLGMTAASVAERLSISENTAKTHMRRIYQKLGVHSRQELLGLAYETAPLGRG